MDRLRVWLSASIAAATICFWLAPAFASTPDIADEEETVIIRCADGQSVRIGAGVVVGRNGGRLLVATAAHLLGPDAMTVELSSGVVLGVTKIERVAGFDLALIETTWYDGFAAAAITAMPTLGEAVHVWGHRLRRAYVESRASIIDLDPALPEGAADGRFAIDCTDCDHGDSGGGVFDESGRLLGILEGARRDQFGTIIFVQVEPIQPLQAELRTFG